MSEIWRDVVGAMGWYEVSDYGSVRSWRKPGQYGKGRRRVTPLILSPGTDSDGRLAVVIAYPDKRRSRMIHQLVMESFVGPRPDGLEACHNDGNNTNNKLSNLRYDTPTSNQADRVLHGTSNRGERMARSKLNRAQVDEIIARCAAGEKQNAVAKIYGVDPSHVSRIVNQGVWSYV